MHTGLASLDNLRLSKYKRSDITLEGCWGFWPRILKASVWDSDEAERVMNCKPTKLEILSLAECQTIKEQILELREYWQADQKGHWEVGSFFTLGLPIYQSTMDFEAYCRSAMSTKTVLLGKLGWLFEIVVDRLSSQLGERVQFRDGLAIPGFHISLPGLQKQKIGAPHFDLQYRHLKRFGITSVVDYGSCTLPVSLPECGGGIHFYDLAYEQHGRQIVSDDLSVLSELDRVTFDYSVGQLFCHSGHSCHQIASFEDCKPSEMRITLQLHIAKCDGDLVAYW